MIERLVDQEMFFKNLFMKIFNCDENTIQDVVKLFNKAVEICEESIIDYMFTNIVDTLECCFDVSFLRENIIYYSLCAVIKELADINDLSEELADKLLESQNFGTQVHFTPKDFKVFKNIKEKQRLELTTKCNKFLEQKMILESK